MALLHTNEALSFVELRTRLGLTEGNLSSHMRTLEKEAYVIVEKFFQGKRPRTLYRLSDKGKQAFHDYVETLRGFVQHNQDS